MPKRCEGPSCDKLVNERGFSHRRLVEHRFCCEDCKNALAAKYTGGNLAFGNVRVGAAAASQTVVWSRFTDLAKTRLA